MDESNDGTQARAKFIEALEKKKEKVASGTNSGPRGDSKVGGGQAASGAPRRFLRKSGSV